MRIYAVFCKRSIERVKLAYLGMGEKYETLLEAFDKFNRDFKQHVGVDRAQSTYRKYESHPKVWCNLISLKKVSYYYPFVSDIISQNRLKNAVSFSITVSRFFVLSSVGVKRDIGGSTLVIAVPVIWINPSRKALSMNL